MSWGWQGMAFGKGKKAVFCEGKNALNAKKQRAPIREKKNTGDKKKILFSKGEKTEEKGKKKKKVGGTKKKKKRQI